MLPLVSRMMLEFQIGPLMLKYMHHFCIFSFQMTSGAHMLPSMFQGFPFSSRQSG